MHSAQAQYENDGVYRYWWDDLSEADQRELEKWTDEVYWQMRQERGDHEEIEF